MKVGISTSVIQNGQTGIAQYVFSLVRALLAKDGGHRLILFVLERDLPLFDFAADRATIVPVSENYRAPVQNILWHQRRLPVLARAAGLDVLHIPSYRRLLWSAPCPTVATIHDLAPFQVRGKYDPLRMFYGRVVVKRLARRQNAIIAISGNTARDLLKFFGLQAAAVIYNGIDHDRFRPGNREAARAAVAARHGIHSPFFLYVARLEHPAKNHLRLIEAFAHFKSKTKSNRELVLAGSDWHRADVIHQAIRNSPCADAIRSLGFVADAALPELYQAADLFVYPSLYEGFGLPPVEAMACGVPVLSSSRGALGEVVGDAALIADPDSVEDMARSMERLSSDDGLRSEFQKAGLARAQCFHWDRNAAEVLKIYARACRQAPGERG